MNRIEELLNSQEAMFNKSQMGRQVFEVKRFLLEIINVKTTRSTQKHLDYWDNNQVITCSTV